MFKTQLNDILILTGSLIKWAVEFSLNLQGHNEMVGFFFPCQVEAVF